WDVATRKVRFTLRGHKKKMVRPLFSPDGKTVVTASEDCLIKLWDAATGLEQATLKGQQKGIFCVALSPDGKLLAAGGGEWYEPEKAELKLWDMEKRQVVATLQGH